MAEKTQYVIELNDKLSPGLKKATAKAMGLDKAMGGIDGKAKKGTKGINMIGGALRSLAGPLALAAAGMKAFQFASESIRVSREFEGLENAITFASGSAQEGAKNMDFLRERSELLGTDLLASSEGFKTLSASMLGSSLQGQGTRDIFDGVQVAASAMGLSSEDAKGTFLALGQIMGKGKVQAEELRGQIGERIPGAFNIAARAMGVSTAELNKMMETGNLIAEDFLPKFSNELKKTFGPGLEKSVNSSQAQFNRFNNTLLELKLTAGKVLLPIVNDIMSGFKKFISFIKVNFGVIKQAFEPITSVMLELKNLVIDFFSRLSGGATITEMLQRAFVGLQRVLKFLEPIYRAALGFWGALFDSIIKIKDAFSGFLDRFPIIGRSFMGLVSLISEGFVIILERAKGILGGVGDLLAGIFSGDLDQIKKGLLGVSKALQLEDAGSRMAGAFSKGFNDTLKNDPLKLETDLGGKKTTSINDVLKQQSLTQGGKLVGGGAGGAAGGKKSSTSVDGVKSGRPTNINIDIGKLIETFNITATNIDDLNNKTKDLVAKALLSAVNNVNNIAQ